MSPTAGAGATVDICVVEEDGRSVRRITNAHGTPKTFDGEDRDEALALAALYLERQFGPLRAAPVPDPEPRPPRPVREPPLRQAD